MFRITGSVRSRSSPRTSASIVSSGICATIRRSALNFSYYGGILDYIEYTLSDHALPGDTPREQTLGPIAVPGHYEVFLIGNGSLMKQPLTITLDPRVHVSQSDLDAQLVATKRIVAGLAASAKAYDSITSLRDAIADRLKTLGPMPEEKPAADGAAGATDAKEKTAEEKAKDAEAAKRAGAAARKAIPRQRMAPIPARSRPPSIRKPWLPQTR